MKVSFNQDFFVIIDEDIKLKAGDMLLEFISADFSDFYLLCDNLIKELEGIAPLNHENTSLSRYLELINHAKESETEFYKALLLLPFYRITKPKYLFATNEIIREIDKCLKYFKGEVVLADADFEFNDDWHNMVIKSIKRYMDTISECSSLFKELSKFCLIEVVSPLEKLNEYGLENILEGINIIDRNSYNNFSLEHKIAVIDGIPSLIEIYNLTTPTQFLYHDFINLVKNGLRIKKCANCGKLFVVFSGHSIEYCDNIPEGETKPCSVIGSARLYTKKVKEDPILEHYTRSYKTHFSRKRAGYLTPEQFKAWSKEAKLMRSRAYIGEISLDEFISWCKN